MISEFIANRSLKNCKQSTETDQLTATVYIIIDERRFFFCSLTEIWDCFILVVKEKKVYIFNLFWI